MAMTSQSVDTGLMFLTEKYKSAVCRALLLEKEFDNFEFIEMKGIVLYGTKNANSGFAESSARKSL